MPQQPHTSGAQPGVTIEPKSVTRVELAPPWKVIVHDDPITLMVYVTMALRRIFGYPQEQAQALMMEVHTKGRAIVWTGAMEQAELYVMKLHAAQLLATMEPSEA
jgi:ATP-dependent Clp protease adaptor protein ClpS